MLTDRANYRKVKIEKASTPRSGLFQIIVDSWWVVTEDDEILFFKLRGANSPQCNQSKEIAEKVRDRIHKGMEVRQIPVVYIPINPRDYV